MDQITAAALAELAGSLSGEPERAAWQCLTTLVQRPLHHGSAQISGSPQISSGELEVAALECAPSDPFRAQALATALEIRAALDDDFRALLEVWRQQLQTASDGEVRNRISGGTQNGPVLQGRDFSGLTFNIEVHTPAAPPNGK
nr:hypothetical protein [Streptomyces sp. SID7805]